MLIHIPYSSLGGADHGWLKAKHHFSFANYYNPQRMGFGCVRVINDDWIQAGKGFPPHPHNNMEIITYVRSGAITHQDSEGNKGVTNSGVIQVMSAGSGIVHSEYNLEAEDLTLYQIWIETNQQDVEPRWQSREFPNQAAVDQLPLLVSGYEEDREQALFIHQQARIFGGFMRAGDTLTQPITHQAYVLASKGQFEIDDQSTQLTLNKGDGAQVTNSASITIKALSDCEIVLIDAPA
ncbi:MAG: pirin family protein [Oceanospirillaceae bacterium]|nr:pirin family protein [Oceanospirillaceae bacterium]